MLEPLRQWICDSCRQVIRSVDEGRIVWQKDENHNAYGLKIVHHPPQTVPGPHCPYCCDDNTGVCSTHLKLFLEHYSRSYVLRFFACGPYCDNEFSGPYVSDKGECDEIIRRLTIPFYEEAKLYWHDAMKDGFFEGLDEDVIYTEDNLKHLVEAYRKQKGVDPEL